MSMPGSGETEARNCEAENEAEAKTKLFSSATLWLRSKSRLDRLLQLTRLMGRS